MPQPQQRFCIIPASGTCLLCVLPATRSPWVSMQHIGVILSGVYLCHTAGKACVNTRSGVEHCTPQCSLHSPLSTCSDCRLCRAHCARRIAACASCWARAASSQRRWACWRVSAVMRERHARRGRSVPAWCRCLVSLDLVGEEVRWAKKASGVFPSASA